jgi:hypothetical protein
MKVSIEVAGYPKGFAKSDSNLNGDIARDDTTRFNHCHSIEIPRDEKAGAGHLSPVAW